MCGERGDVAGVDHPQMTAAHVEMQRRFVAIWWAAPNRFCMNRGPQGPSILFRTAQVVVGERVTAIAARRRVTIRINTLSSCADAVGPLLSGSGYRVGGHQSSRSPV